MSMLFELRQVPLATLEALQRDASDIHFFLHGVEQTPPALGFLQRLFRRQPEAPAPRDWTAPDPADCLSLDRNWHLLHYIYSRQAWDAALPQGTLLSGGHSLGNIDVGYGPARALTPEETERFADFLRAITKDEFAADIKAADLLGEDIYGHPGEWNEAYRQALWDYHCTLLAFLERSLDKDQAIILYLF